MPWVHPSEVHSGTDGRRRSRCFLISATAHGIVTVRENSRFVFFGEVEALEAMSTFFFFFRGVFYALEGFTYLPFLYAEPGWLIPALRIMLLILWRERFLSCGISTAWLPKGKCDTPSHAELIWNCEFHRRRRSWRNMKSAEDLLAASFWKTVRKGPSSRMCIS